MAVISALATWLVAGGFLFGLTILVMGDARR